MTNVMHIVLCCVFVLLIANVRQARTGGLQSLGADGSLIQCGGPVQLSWINDGDAAGETQVAVIDESGKLVRSFDNQPANTFSVTWYPINASAHQRLFLWTRDADGQTAVSKAMVVEPGATSEICSPIVEASLPSFTLFSGAPVSSTLSASSSVSISSTSSLPLTSFTSSSSIATSTPSTQSSDTGTNSASSTSATQTAAGPTNASWSLRHDSAVTIITFNVALVILLSPLL